MLLAHMTGLAKPNQVFPSVCILSGFKQAKWSNVVNREALADVFAAIVAVPCLIFDDLLASGRPTASTVCLWATNPVWGERAFRLSRVTARRPAISCQAVLPRKPRLLPEMRSAFFANALYAGLPIWVRLATDFFRRERVRWPFPFPELISNQVRFGGCVQKGYRLPATAAQGRAKSGFVFPVWLNEKGFLARFAYFLNHSKIITSRRCIGNRTTLVACKRVEEAYRQPDLFVEPPTPPKQEAFDL